MTGISPFYKIRSCIFLDLCYNNFCKKDMRQWLNG